MKWYNQVPFTVYSIILSVGVGLVLWYSGATGEGAAILSALGLELVIVVHRIHHELERINDPLRGLIHSARLKETLTGAKEILATKNRQSRALLTSATIAYADRINALRAGEVRYSPAEFMEFAENLFRSAKPGDTLRATSHLAGGEYWNQIYGKRYEQLNRSANLNGCSIERIFLLRDEDHLRTVQDVLARQCDFSTVRVVLYEHADGTMDLTHRDFFVYKDELVAEFVFIEPGMVLSHMRLSTDKEQIRKLTAEYERLRHTLSREYLPLTEAGAS